MPFLVPDKVLEPLYVIVPVMNAWRWKSRWKHAERTLKHFHDSGAVIVLVEVAFNRRTLAFDNLGLDGTLANCNVIGDKKFKHKYIGLRSKEELWLKENMINTAVSMALPYDWQQVAWIDADVHFLRPNWVGECIHKLQHYSWLQMFSHARDLGPNSEMLPENYPHANGGSFMSVYQDGGLPALRKAYGAGNDGYYYGAGGAKPWPGLAWACTREAWDAVGGLIDIAVWGGGDWHIAHALVGKRDGMMHNGLHENYKQIVTSWADKWEDSQRIRRNVGMMEGSIVHAWHGRKTERGYSMKHRLLAEIGFDPVKHLKRDYQGLWQLHDDGSEAFIRMRDEMRVIANDRNEDSIDVFSTHEDGQGH